MARLFFYFFTVLLITSRFYVFYTTPKSFKEGDNIRITAKVTSEPVHYETKQYLKLEGLKVYLPLYPEIGYGDNIVVQGKVEKGTLTNPKLVRVKESNNLGYKLRQEIIDNYKKALPSPHSSLVAGMVLGSKANIPKDFWDKLKSTGTAHVVVASGMNISLTGNFLIGFLTLFWKRRKALFFTLIGIWLYAFLTGFDAPIIRAAVMGTIAFLAQYLGRTSEAVRALLISAFIMLIIYPGFLTDLGFLLSFFATLSLILFEPKVKGLISRPSALLRLIRSDTIHKTIINDFSTSLAAQIGVAPILYFYFGQLNMLSPLINTLILWTVVPVTIIGMVSGVVGLIFEPLGRIILYFAYPLTLFFVKIVELFS